MRNNQISITITRFNDQVPKGYPEDTMVIHIYADSNNLYVAMSQAYAKAINVIEEWEIVGSTCDISTNADGNIPGKLLDRKYSENINLEYLDSALEMDKKLLGYIENAENIIKVIKSSTRETVRSNLQEKLGYSLEETNNILRINFGMMTAEDVEEIKSGIVRREAMIKQRMVNQGVGTEK